MEVVDKIIEGVKFVFSFKAYVMLPIVILIFGIVIRMKILDAFLSAIKLGVGFAAIFFVFAFFVANIGPAVQAILTTRGLDFPVLDVGWPPLAAITWAGTIAPLMIPLFLVTNIVMIALKATRTIYIDIWNYWHFALLGTLVAKSSDNIFIGLAAAVLIGIYTIKLSDWTVPHVERECGLSGITISPLSVVGLLPYGVLMNKLFDKIPGFRKLDFNPGKSEGRFGFVSEPMIIGLAVGLFLGILAGYDIKALLELSINIAAVMFVLPLAGGLLGKGMEPVSLKLKSTITKFFPKRDNLVIAMDAPVLLQNKSVVVTGLILMPLAILIAFVLPGNKTLPLGDLPNLIAVMSVIVLVSRSNVIRAVLLGLPVVVSYLWISTNLAPLITTLSRQAGVGYESSYSGDITAFTDGGNQIRFWFLHMFQGNIIALLVIPVVLLLLFFTWRDYKKTIALQSKAESKQEIMDTLDGR
jgi:galactitol PTS system EIIC component